MIVPLFFVLFISLVTTCSGHGSMVEPPPRGALRGGKLYPRDMPVIDKNAPKDHKLHFPAGDKRPTGGAGKNYQRRTGRVYMEYAPMDPRFRWRAGVCGDTVKGPNARDHLKGGKYYHGGKIVRTYRAGSAVAFKVAINAHHKGFFRFHICNVKNCPNGEIGFKCFNRRNCRELQRIQIPKCQSRYSQDCSPVDPSYKGRFYVPCENRKGGRRYSVYGLNGEMLYRLPKGFKCKHCVLQFFWTSGNNCKPKGVLKYFLSNHAPKRWSKCLGNLGHRGSYTAKTQQCEKNTFPEEYYQCADVRIV